MRSKRILLVHPKLGMSGSLVKHMPLSLLYAAVDSMEAGFEIDIVDARVDPNHWKDNIESKVTQDTLLIGVSVMTGAPINNALDISRWAKSAYPHIKVVWGGPHATFNGAEILQEPSVDFAVGGYGSKPLAMLAKNLRGDKDAVPLSSIPGLLYRDNGGVSSVPPENAFEFVDYRKIPYHLLEGDLDKYGQLDRADRIFPMYSVMGCPYQCAFCSSPAQYKNIRKKYQPYDISEIVDHVQLVQEKYGATYIYFIDDDSFVNLKHVDNIIDAINRRGIRIKLGFRGARINEIKKMSDEFLDKLAAAGADIMHIGAESGSQRILDLINKNCTVRDIIEVNLKMKRHPQIKTAYNFIAGLPTETVEDLLLTRDLMQKLTDDNPSAIIFIPNKFRPLPGTELYDLAVQYGYTPPSKLEEWIHIDAESDYRPPWYTKRIANMINMLQVASFFIDDKIFKLETGDTIKFMIIRFLARIYTPFAKLRFKTGTSRFLLEYKIFQLFTSSFRR